MVHYPLTKLLALAQILACPYKNILYNMETKAMSNLEAGMQIIFRWIRKEISNNVSKLWYSVHGIRILPNIFNIIFYDYKM